MATTTYRRCPGGLEGRTARGGGPSGTIGGRRCTVCGRTFAHPRQDGKVPLHAPLKDAGGRYRSSLAQERQRRRVDAKAQPRTPVTKQRFWFVTSKRRRIVRRPLDAEAREEYQNEWSDLGYGIDGLAHAIYALKKEIERDKYDQGGHHDYRHDLKGKKAFTPTGRRIRTYASQQGGARDAMNEAKARLRALRDELREAKQKRADIADVLKHGELPGHYRRRLARARARRR